MTGINIYICTCMYMYLRTTGDLLPLDLHQISSIALIGPHCNDTEVLLGNYHGISSHVVTPLEAILEVTQPMGISVLYSEGVAITGDGIFMLETVLSLARKADVVIMCMGLSAKKTGSLGYINNYVYPALEKESLDRYTLRLPGTQLDIMKGIKIQTDTPIVLVLVNGGPVAIEWELQEIPAILEAWYGGEEVSPVCLLFVCTIITRYAQVNSRTHTLH